MRQVELARTGEQVSELCLGTMLMGSTIDERTAFAMLDRYVDLGGNFLDTANCYAWWVGHGEFVGDESEELLGQWFAARRNRHEVFLATKVGARMTDLPSLRDASGEIDWDRVGRTRERQTPETIRAAIDASLRRLGTDHVDLYYSHLHDRSVPLEDVLGTLNELVVAGKVRYIGLSNYRTWQLERARQVCRANGWAQPVAIEQQASYPRPRPGADFGVGVNEDDELRDYLAANPEVVLLAYSPLLKGIYEDETKRRAYYNWSLFDTPDSAARLGVLSEVAAELGVSNSQGVIAWLLARATRTIPIVAGSRLAQLEHNLAAAEIRLAPDQLARLDAAGC